MAVLEEIGQEKQRISERLMRLDEERTRLSGQLDELQIAERALMRFRGKADAVAKPSRARPAKTAPAAGPERRARNGRQTTMSLKEAALTAVRAHAKGASADELRNYLAREFGLMVRPNHLGSTLHGHRRAGRLENRDQRWYLRSST
jgi:hypothetical protein